MKKMSLLELLPYVIIGAVVIVSLTLHFHNVGLYHYDHGFDGAGHVFYIQYVMENWRIPPSNLGWETHQSPLYYFLGAGVGVLTGTWKTAHYLNTFILWLTIAVASAGFWKIFKNKYQVSIGVLSLAALPMLNIFPAMVSNELMNTFWSICCLVLCIYLLKAKGRRDLAIHSSLVTICFILGFWTKVSIVMIAPVIAGTYLYLLVKQKNNNERAQLLGIMLLSLLVVVIVSLPILLRSFGAVGPSNLTAIAVAKNAPHDLMFFTRLDWIWKVDMYNTQYYSALGGAWNSFWSDGQNAITPFVPFHKKAFILWTLGFVLFPLSLFGQYLLLKKDKVLGVFTVVSGLLLFAVYIFYNTKSGHYSAARLTYQMPIVFPYAVGIAAASYHKKLKYVILLLLLIQFTVMVSFFWIEPWWHVTKPIW